MHAGPQDAIGDLELRLGELSLGEMGLHDLSGASAVSVQAAPARAPSRPPMAVYAWANALGGRREGARAGAMPRE